MARRKAEHDQKVDSYQEIPTAETDLTQYPTRIGGTASAVRTVDGAAQLITRIDEDSVTAGTFYVGKAVSGASESGSVWAVKRIIVQDNAGKLGVHIDWADGNTDFDNDYSNREALTYS